MYNVSIVCLKSFIFFAMHLVISSYAYDENMVQFVVQFNLINLSILKSEKQIEKQKHLTIMNNMFLTISASLVWIVIIVNTERTVK